MNDRSEHQATPPPPRGPSTAAVLVMLFLVLLAVGAALWIGVAWGERIGAGAASDHDHADHAMPAGEGENQYWTCGMHPWVILPQPGDCPICRMDLTPLDPGKLAGELVIDPVVVQNIGVRTAPVAVGPLTKEVRTVGNVTYDETAVRDVSTKVAGWIEELYVDYEGVAVEEGEPLFELYSPELYSAQEEYLLAYENRSEVGSESLPAAAEGAGELLEAARTRLVFFDVSPEQIAELRERGEPSRTLTIHSPHTGIVIDKNANEGTRIEPGTRVYRIADLSEVWVMATVYGHQLPLIQPGQRAVMTLDHLPERVFEGEVMYVYPYLNERSRQAKVRLEFDNPDGLLKPGMFATVHLENTLEERAVLIPSEAVIGTGEREVAFVSMGGGRFEPREVTTGVRMRDGTVQVLSGLEPGERVVTSGQFLLDSESRMREALAKMVEGDSPADQEPTAEAAGPSEWSEMPDAAAESIAAMLDAYFAIGDALGRDTLEGVGPEARDLHGALGDLLETDAASDPSFRAGHGDDLRTVRDRAADLAEPSGLEDARVAYGVMSDALDRLIAATGVPPSYGEPIDRRVCGMFEEAPRDGVWLQPADRGVRNPYMGPLMPGCNLPDQHRRMPVTGGGGEP